MFWVFKVFIKEERNIEFMKDFLYNLEIYERLKNVHIICNTIIVSMGSTDVIFFFLYIALDLYFSVIESS